MALCLIVVLLAIGSCCVEAKFLVACKMDVLSNSHLEQCLV